MNTKLKEFFKKVLTFVKNNWIAIAIIVGLIIFGGGLNSCASKKIDAANTKIAELEKSNKEQDEQMKEREKLYKKIDKEMIVVKAELEALRKEKKKIEANKKVIDKKYAALRKKFGNLSAAQQDALLLDVLKKNGITAEIRENSLLITLDDRGILYTMVISVDELREKLSNSEEANVNCLVTVTKKDEQIKLLTDMIVLKDLDIGNLDEKITNLNQIIKEQKTKLFWTRVNVFGKSAIPALIIGLVVGFLVAK